MSMPPTLTAFSVSTPCDPLKCQFKFLLNVTVIRSSIITIIRIIITIIFCATQSNIPNTLNNYSHAIHFVPHAVWIWKIKTRLKPAKTLHSTCLQVQVTVHTIINHTRANQHLINMERMQLPAYCRYR